MTEEDFRLPKSTEQETQDRLEKGVSAIEIIRNLTDATFALSSENERLREKIKKYEKIANAHANIAFTCKEENISLRNELQFYKNQNGDNNDKQ